MNKEEKREQEKENLYKNVKQFIYSLKREKSMLNRRLNEIGKLEKEILLILSNPELAKEILGDKEQEEYTLTPDENGTTQINGKWYRVDKK